MINREAPKEEGADVMDEDESTIPKSSNNSFKKRKHSN